MMSHDSQNSVKSYPLNKIKAKKNSQSQVSKKKLYSLTSFILIFSLISGFVVGNIFAQKDIIRIPTENLFRSKSELTFDMEISINQDPLDIFINLDNIYSSDPITSAKYKIYNITEWVSFPLLNNQSHVTIAIDHGLYYDLLNLQTNTVEVSISNDQSYTISKVANFTI